jgi:hypothetical protein
VSDLCPTCGSPVRVVSSDEGTSHYEPLARPAPPSGGLDVERLLRVERAARDLDNLAPKYIRGHDWSGDAMQAFAELRAALAASERTKS